MLLDSNKWQKIVTLLEGIPNRRKERRKEGKNLRIDKVPVRGSKQTLTTNIYLFDKTGLPVIAFAMLSSILYFFFAL